MVAVTELLMLSSSLELSMRVATPVCVMEELVKFTYLTRDRSDYLTDRYSERKESAEQLMARVNQRSM